MEAYLLVSPLSPMGKHRSDRNRVHADRENWHRDPAAGGGGVSVGFPGNLLPYAWLPIPILLGLLWLAELRPIDVGGLDFVRPTLNLVFGVVVILGVAGLAAYGFLRNGSVTVLLFGASLLFLAGVILSANFIFHFLGDLSAGATVYTTGVAVSGLLQLVVGILSWIAGEPAIRRRGLVLGSVYTAVAAAVLSLDALAMSDALPIVLVRPDGTSTPIRRLLLIQAVAAYAVAAVLILAVSRRRNWTFGRWYGLALALLATGLFGVSYVSSIGSAAEWIARVAGYLGGLYLLVAAIALLQDHRQWGALTYSELRASEERLRRLSEAAIEGIAFVSSGRIIDANEQLARMLGFDPKELLGRSFASFAPAEERKRVAEAIERADEDFLEHRLMRKNDGEIFVESRGRTLAQPNESLRLIVVNDITVRRQQEESLRASEKRLRELFENMSEGFAVGEPILSPDGAPHDVVLTMVNKAFMQQTGLTGDVIGRPVRSILPNLEPSWIERNTQVALTGESLRFEGYNHDTGRIYETVCFSPGKGRFATLFKDITEQKATEENLRRSEEANRGNLARINAIIQHLTEGLLTLDAEGALVEMNPAARRLYGLTPDMLTPASNFIDRFNTWFEYFDLAGRKLPPGDNPAIRALRRETFQSCTIRVRRIETGNEWIGSYGGRPVFGGQGEFLFALLTVRDVTREKEAEWALQRSRDDLEATVRERTAELQQRADQLAWLTSELTLAEDRERRRLAQFLHDDLQQLLVAAKFRLHRLFRDLPGIPRDRLSDLENLLDQSIQTSRSLTMELSPPILHEGGLEPALEWLVRWMKKTHDLTVGLTLDAGFTVEREDIRLLLFQAIRELLFNVIKHARTNQAAVRISRSTDQQYLEAIVEDQGAGFDSANIFERTGLGTEGLGLFSIRERVKLLGGHFHVVSAPGRGSRFTLALPLSVVTKTAAEEAGAPAPLPERIHPPEVHDHPANGTAIRVLLADDHDVVRQGISSLLKAEDDVVIVGEAADGAGAVEMARERHPDVIVMDASMPGMDGIEATRVIHAELPRTGIIGLSMYDENDLARAMLDAGAAAYLCKSGKSETLLATIRQVAESARHPQPPL